MSQPIETTDVVLNTASILKSYCGRNTTTGLVQTCSHDHTGDASALVNMVMQRFGPELLAEILASTKADTIPRATVQARHDELTARRDAVVSAR